MVYTSTHEAISTIKIVNLSPQSFFMLLSGPSLLSFMPPAPCFLSLQITCVEYYIVWFFFLSQYIITFRFIYIVPCINPWTKYFSIYLGLYFLSIILIFSMHRYFTFFIRIILDISDFYCYYKQCDLKVFNSSSDCYYYNWLVPLILVYWFAIMCNNYNCIICSYAIFTY